MLSKGFELHLESELYDKHAALVKKIEASPRQWEEFEPDSDGVEQDVHRPPQPEDGLLPHQLEAIKSVRDAASTPA